MLPGLAERRSEQLPAEVTPFIGRASELAEVTELLRTSRLVTITGTGGVGKTRLALKAAAGVAGGYRDGVRMVELSSVRDPELLVNAIAVALDVSDANGRSEMDAVLEYLRRRQLLLILDTCEHLVDACALLAEAIVREAPEVTVLTTSRQPLDTPGELTCALPPMRVPGPGEEDGPGDPVASDALALFSQRAAAVRPGFTVTPGNRADVIRVCQRLDGIPLAIELAAVRLRALPLRDLVERLDRKFQVLTGGRRVRQNRHQTLHGAIAWSHDLCTPAEQRLWARLSVFRGTFDIDSAEEICASDEMDADEITETIISLIDKSLIMRTGPDGDRYRLLDTIREFGAERLAASGDAARIRRQHFEYYFGLARDFAATFISGGQLERITRLLAEDANFQAALEHALADPDRGADAARLAGALFLYWYVSARLREGRLLVGKVLGRFPSPSRERAGLLLDAAFLDAFQGQHQGTDEAREGTRIAEELGDERLLTRSCLARNMALTFAGHYDEALAAGEEAGRRLEGADESSLSLLFLDMQMSATLTLAGQFDQGYERCQRGLRRLGEDSGEQWLRSYFCAAGALALYHQGGRERECAAYAARALPAEGSIGNSINLGHGLELLGWLAADARRYERAAWLLGAAQVLWEAAGGRLQNNAILEESHQRAVKKACQGLPRGRFDELHRQGRACPLAAMVKLAIEDADTLPPSVQRAAAPEAEPPADGLTQREREIAALVADGLSNREVGERLVISRRTVDAHVEHIYAKLGISNRVQLARRLSQGS